ncbi:MAG TPA: FtsX-like permease family protein [Longimicrobiales bacterium]|nr:FtsX-like permease family protein [Longimicrobiales bacterium]
MRTPFAFAHAARELRSSGRRIGLYMGSITLGVAALVAINSFRANILDSVDEQARQLLGADFRLQSSTPFAPRILAAVDSLRADGAALATVTSTASMALAPRPGTTRLVQLRGVEGDYPFYTRLRSAPASAWGRLRHERVAVVDPALLLQLGAHVGDTLEVGGRRLPIAGTIEDSPGDVSFRAALAPRVYIPDEALRATGLLGFGSLVQYEIYVRLPDEGARRRFLDAHRPLFRENRIDIDTAEGQARGMTRALDSLSKFLALAGLAALLLGGVGVASAIHVFVKEKLDTVAVLRCLGARQRSVFGAYLLQAALLGLLGAAAGALLGLAVQAVLPSVLGSFLPVDVPFAIDVGALLAGLATGVWVASVFALIPLLAIRNVAPLQALRRDYEPPRRRDPLRALAMLALAASVVALSLWQAPYPRAGLGFALGLAITVGLLALVALGLVRGTRRFFPGRARYVVRQGISNLYRPHNQTTAVTLALGFGIFLIASLYLIHGAILDRLSFGGEAARANVLLFDVQPDQLPRVQELFRRQAAPLSRITPIVPARLQAINGRTIPQLLADTGRARPQPWALRREYRNTYRDTLTSTETLVAGSWWVTRRPSRGPGERESGGYGSDLPLAHSPTSPLAPSAAAPARISVEEGLAQQLRVHLGDTITWDFHGVPVPSVVGSIRRVEWARFEPNFFVVFEPGSIDDAPQTFVALSDIPDRTRRARVQAELAHRFPNISALDLSLLQETLDRIIGKVSLAVRFLALFSVAAGVLVLVGALSTSRHQRIRESALLKTLGATRRQITRILFTEYAALGLLAGLAGTLLALLGAWALTRFFFEIPFRPPILPLVAAWLLVAALAVAIGVLSSREVLRRPPLAVLRDAAEG